MLQEQPPPPWGNHPPGSAILLKLCGDAATTMREEPASNLMPLLKQHLSLGEVILLQKRKDKQMLPYRFSTRTMPTWQGFQECRWDYSTFSLRTLIYKHSSLSWLALDWGLGYELQMPLLSSSLHASGYIQENLDGYLSLSLSLYESGRRKMM